MQRSHDRTPKNLRTIPKSALLLSAVMLVFTVVTAILICSISELSIPTALFAMVACAAYNIKTDHGYMPLRLRQFIQVFAGALIGTTVGRRQSVQMLELWDVILVAVISFIVLDLAAGFLIEKYTDMDLTTALFSCAPGGLTDMTLIAADLGPPMRSR